MLKEQAAQMIVLLERIANALEKTPIQNLYGALSAPEAPMTQTGRTTVTKRARRTATEAQVNRIYGSVRSKFSNKGADEEELDEIIDNQFGADMGSISKDEASRLIDLIDKS